MLALLQRVKYAEVVIENKSFASIQHGILVFLGIEKKDTEAEALRLIKKIKNYRIFADKADKMNLSVEQVEGELLIVPQFTLSADTNKGLRPNFSPAASPDLAAPLFNFFMQQLLLQYKKAAQGKFGADMQIKLCNDGPVTFLLHE